MLSEEYLWRVERSLEKQRLDRVSPQVPWTVETSSSVRRHRLPRRSLRRMGISGSSSVIRVVLQQDEIISYAGGGSRAMVACLAGNVEVAQPGKANGSWKALVPGDQVPRWKRKPLVVRALALSTVEFRAG